MSSVPQAKSSNARFYAAFIDRGNGSFLPDEVAWELGGGVAMLTRNSQQEERLVIDRF
jgi:hypothetical protein